MLLRGMVHGDVYRIGTRRYRKSGEEIFETVKGSLPRPVANTAPSVITQAWGKLQAMSDLTDRDGNLVDVVHEIVIAARQAGMIIG